MIEFARDDDNGGNLLYITPEDVTQHPLPWQEKGLSYTASGYGNKIPTSRMVKLGKRWYRVYCCIYSNAGTSYIIKDKKKYVIRDSDLGYFYSSELVMRK